MCSLCSVGIHPTFASFVFFVYFGVKPAQCPRPMQRRPLGRTGLHVSTVGFGGSSIGGVFRPVSAAAAEATVKTALEVGINYFDTAPYYAGTTAESILGKALTGVPRDRYVLATKVGRYGRAPVKTFDFSADRVVRSVDESLERLGCGHIDLIQVHDLEFGSLPQIWNETLPALDQLRKSGKVRFCGITGLPLAALRRVQEQAGALVDTVLSYCHGTLIDLAYLPYAAELRASGKGVLNAAPLGMGLLTNAGPPPWHPAPEELRAACAAAASYCTLRGADLADLALSHAFNLPHIDCTIVGLGSVDEVQRAVACAAQPPDVNLLAGVLTLLEPVHGMTWTSGRTENN